MEVTRTLPAPCPRCQTGVSDPSVTDAHVYCDCMCSIRWIVLTLVLVEVEPGSVTTGVSGTSGPFPSGPFPSGPFPSGPFPSGPFPPGCSRRRPRLSSPRAVACAPVRQLHRAMLCLPLVCTVCSYFHQLCTKSACLLASCERGCTYKQPAGAQFHARQHSAVPTALQGDSWLKSRVLAWNSQHQCQTTAGMPGWSGELDEIRPSWPLDLLHRYILRIIKQYKAI